ncbi:MAG: hypothetical protein M3R13_09095 [Armatimonadota bacterium]|nr:hypothetical protein [Armatimonadota bacterium]
MNKDDLLAAVREMAREGRLTEQEVLDAYRGTSAPPPTWLSPTLAFVGSMLVAAALHIFFMSLGIDPFEGALVCLVAVTMAMITGAAASKSTVGRPLSEPLLFLAGLVTPLLLIYSAQAAGYNASALSVQSVLGLVGAAAFLPLALRAKSTVCIVMSALFAGWSFTTFCTWGAEQMGMDTFAAFNYALAAYGLSLTGIAHMVKHTPFRNSFALISTLGSIAVLWAGAWLCRWGSDPNWLWIAVYPILAFGVLIWGSSIRLKGFVHTGCLALFAYLLLVTRQLFSESAAWPAAVAVIGGALLATGFFLSRRGRGGAKVDDQ